VEIATVLFSALAIIVSVVVALLQLQMHREQQNVQRRLAAIEEGRRSEELEERARADLRARLEPLDMSRAVVTVVNHGKDVAHDLAADVRASTSGRLPPQIRNDEDFPIPMLRPSEEATIRLDYARGNTDHTCDVVLSWVDGRGRQEDVFKLRHPRRN